MSSYGGFLLLALVFVLLWRFGVKRSHSNFGQALRLAFDGIWETFDELLGPKASYPIKMYVVALFFVVLVSNVLGVCTDILRFVFPQMGRFISVPTAEFETTLALACIATVVPLVLQVKQLGLKSFLHEYVPITGK